METEKRIPTHVSIIMDGNGRWAKERGMERTKGHIAGVESVRACTIAAIEEGVKYLSFFAFSEENWGRPEGEVNSLMKLMFESMQKEFEMFVREGVRFVVIGDRERLGSTMCGVIDNVMEATKNNDRLTFILFISYSGKWDIHQAARKMAADMAAHPEKEISEADFGNYLATAGIPDPDLLIRTSGEKRISNYMLWQLAYTELLSTPVLWPDFGKEDFKAALDEYAKRDRRYGKVK
ncbi:MAG: di-trans,poly-cis-decaprenylcistransferase [Bacteroidales bacterium]|nr:di-trans,poly-cis-decaprenylcistransferase [Bacteroidales bacterium]